MSDRIAWLEVVKALRNPQFESQTGLHGAEDMENLGSREAAMKAVAFANNDIAVVAWTFGGKLPDCLGFAVYRIDVRAGTEPCLPAMATFSGQQATPGRTPADDPIQKFFWKDVYAKRGGTYKYKIVPMTGTPGSLQPMPYGPCISNQVQLSPHYA